MPRGEGILATCCTRARALLAVFFPDGRDATVCLQHSAPRLRPADVGLVEKNRRPRNRDDRRTNQPRTWKLPVRLASATSSTDPLG